VSPVFDRSDARYLAATLSVGQLREEIRHAEVRADVAKAFYDPDDLFPWADYAGVCRDAIKIMGKKPKPNPGGSNLDATVVKAHNDIVDVIGEYTNLQKTGKNFKGLCPLHAEKDPSFFVYPDEQRFHCYGCQKSGDVISFIMAIKNVDFKQALAVLG
jgi:hypothetical protein